MSNPLDSLEKFGVDTTYILAFFGILIAIGVFLALDLDSNAILAFMTLSIPGSPMYERSTISLKDV